MSDRPYITCRELIEFLDPERKRETDRHLASCGSCLSYWRSYRTTISLARRACFEEDAGDLPTPGTLTRRILDAVSSRFQVPGSRKPLFHVVHLLSGIAAAPLLALWLR